jgi:hypothetical protein
MAGSVGLVQFNQGDDVCSAEFREGLNAVAQQAADGTAWAFGFGLIGSYSPGTGFTLAFDEALLPVIRKESFLARITAAANDDLGYEWKEMETTGEFTIAEKTNGRKSTQADEEADPPTAAKDLAYDLNGSSSIPVDRNVIMWEIEDTGGIKRYWIDGGGSDFIEAEITDYDEGYHSWEQVGGTQTGTLNLREINGRRITPGHKVLIWPDPNDAGKYLFDRGEGVSGGDGEVEIIPGDGGGGTWDRTTDTTARGGGMKFIGALRYSDGQLQAVIGAMSWDSSGRITQASAGDWSEYEIIFEAEECPPGEGE